MSLNYDEKKNAIEWDHVHYKCNVPTDMQRFCLEVQKELADYNIELGVCKTKLRYINQISNEVRR